MRNQSKKKESGIAELATLQQQVVDLEKKATEYRRLVGALQVSEIRHRRLFETTQDGILILDAETGQISDVNPFLMQMLGYSHEDFLGRKLWEIGAFKNIEASQKTFSELQTKEYVRYEDLPLETGDGRLIDVEFVSNVYLVDHKKVIQCNIRDITERKNAEEKLRAREERYRSYIEVTGHLAWTTNADGQVVEDIPVWRKFTGQSEEETKGAGWAKALHPEDVKHTMEVWNNAVATKSSYEVEYRIRRHDGVYRHFWVHGVPVVKEDASIREWVGTCVDISERKQIEDAQKFLVQCGLPASGEDFFKSLARYLAENLGGDYVCIDRLQEEGLAAQTVAIYFDGEFEDNMTYTLKDTPCGDVLKKRICCFPKGVRHLYPQDVVLQEMMAESYIGTILWSSTGRPIGLIAIIGRQPLANPQLAESMLELVGVRAAGELERREAEDGLRQRGLELQQLNQTLEQRVHERTKELRQSQGRLRQLASQLLMAQENERKRIANELHDSLLSELAAMKYLFEAKMNLLMKGKLADPSEFNRIADIMQKVIRDTRGIMNNLHPPILDEMGLIPTIDWLLRGYQKTYGHIQVRKQVAFFEQDIPMERKIVIFRVLQEALNNFAKHGNGNLVELSLSKSDSTLHLNIQDHGQGFDMKKVRKGMGLESMKERVEISGGSFHIESGEGKGTTISASWSLDGVG